MLAGVLRQDKACIFKVQQSFHQHYCENHKFKSYLYFSKTLEVMESYGNEKGLRNIICHNRMLC